MSVDSNSRSVRGKVRWRRLALVAVPAFAIAGTMVGLTAEGALASSISVSGQQFTITADQLQGTGFAQFGGVANLVTGAVPLTLTGVTADQAVILAGQAQKTAVSVAG